MKRVICASTSKETSLDYLTESSSILSKFTKTWREYFHMLFDNLEVDEEKANKIREDSEYLNKEMSSIEKMSSELLKYCEKLEKRAKMTGNQELSKEDKAFYEFYQNCWDALIEKVRKTHSKLEVAQNTQGDFGTTDLYYYGWDAAEYYSISESQAVSNVRKLFEQGNTSVEDGIEAIYEAGLWKDDGYDDGYDDED